MYESIKKFQNKTLHYFLDEIKESEIPNINSIMFEILDHFQTKLRSNSQRLANEEYYKVKTKHGLHFCIINSITLNLFF